jgi:uncharacterized protein involved in outer membrane biogenesis
MTRHQKKHFAVRSVLVAGLILVVVTVLAVNLFADRAVRVGIESSATKTLNVAVTVSNVDLSIMDGKLALQNLLINNPPDYQHDKLLELKNAEIEIEVKSLLSDVVNIREIKLDGVDVVLEQRDISSNNLQDVITSIHSASKEGEGKSLRVDNLEMSNITVRMKLPSVPAQDDTITLELSPIRMTNLGRDSKLDLADLSGEIVLAIANRLVEQGVGVLPEDIITTLTPSLDKTIDISTRIIESTEDIGKEITEGIKSLLKPKEEEYSCAA